MLFFSASVRVGRSWPMLRTLFSTRRAFPATRLDIDSAWDRQQRKTFSSLDMAPAPLEEGDHVRVAVNGGVTLSGVVKERRGRGWYSVQVPSSDGGQVIKVRSTQMEAAAAATPKRSSTDDDTARQGFTLIQEEQVVAPTLPPPTIVDLDAIMAASRDNLDAVQNKQDRLHLEQCLHHASFDKWVMFTDLHCAPSTIDTCLQVLHTVHQTAVERDAGVLFLGDWWHHRGTIRVDLLNAVLEALRSWQVPMVMIPGNHDQVTLGGHNHGLRPLQHAYRVERRRQTPRDRDESTTATVPGPLVFSHPTKFSNALFVPHLRDHTVMESVLQSQPAKDASALFVHADVTGAYMNDLIVSQGGVSPACFPTHTPIYSGHFHKPHVVQAGNVTIDYVGSPYQTSLSEAQQDKALWVLDASQGWKCMEKISLHIGRRHFQATSLEELKKFWVQRREDAKEETNTVGKSLEAASTEEPSGWTVVDRGDRVIVSIPKEDLDQMRRRAVEDGLCEFDSHVRRLRQAGALVEIREIKSVALEPMGAGRSETDSSILEEMTPQATLAAYFSEEVRREVMKNSTAERLLKAGLSLIEELELSEENSDKIAESGNMTDLVLESATLQGFGPFKEQVTYPLLDRGLVLIRGTNRDGGSDSNGSGKSSLAMATLWALTGTVDPRPVQDAKVSDVVNDHCKTARVSVRGTLNGEEFVISRTKTSSKGFLSFHLGEDDLTAQSAKETQALIDETLGVGPEILARTMFHGQHSIHGLLETTDAKLKEELSLVVPLTLWQESAALARKKSRNATKEASELQGMISLRSQDVEILRRRREEAERFAVAKLAAFREEELELESQIKEQSEVVDDVPLETFEGALSDTANQVEALEAELRDIFDERDREVSQLEARVDEMSAIVDTAREKYQDTQRELDRSSMMLTSARDSQRELEQRWGLEISSGVTPEAPLLCPTCKQPIGVSGEGHSHEEVRNIIENDMDKVKRALQSARDRVDEATKASDTTQHALSSEQARLDQMVLELQQVKSGWVDKLQVVEKRLQDARKNQMHLSSKMSDAARRVRQQSEVQAMESRLKTGRDAAEAAEAVHRQLDTELKEAESKLKELKVRGESERNLAVTMMDLADLFGQRGVQSFVLQNAIEALQTTCQSYLNELSDGGQRLELSLDAGDRISRRALIRGPDGTYTERPLSSLSGGQWRRCSLSLSLGFADLVAMRGRLRPSLCVFDEPLTHLDRAGRGRVGGLLRKLLRKDDHVRALGGNGMSVSTILLILQDLAAEELEESFDRIDEVVKLDGMSTVAVDEQA